MHAIADPRPAALPHPPSAAGWRSVIGERNILLLAVHPGDETALFGGLIARACAAGRAPFVAVLTDGSTQPGAPGEDPRRVALRRERETRAAAAALGLEDDRLLFVGLFDGTVPGGGPMFDALVAAMDLVMWRNDCTVLVAADGGDADTQAALLVARAAARRTGLGLVMRVDGPGGTPLDGEACGAGLEGGIEAYAPADLRLG